MLDDSDNFEVAKPRTLNLIPIVDMLTTIILFLVLSTSVYHFTKQTLPPSGVSTAGGGSAVEPLALKVFSYETTPGRYRVAFQWRGANPSSRSGDFELPARPFSRENTKALVENLELLSDNVAKEIGVAEKTVRISFNQRVPYQLLITTMDAVRKNFPDMVITSWEDADHFAQGANQ